MIPVLVSDAADPRLHDYIGLTDMALRRHREPAEGLFIGEGEKVIRRALAAGHPLRSLLLAAKWLPGLADVVEATDAPVYLASDAVLEQVTGFAVHRGALASLHRLPLPPAEDLLARSRRVAVLEDFTNHTNTGAVFRAAAALGMDAVLLSPRCADPLYRRSVKVSMGTVFAVPWALLAPWPDALAQVRSAGFTLLALTPDPSTMPLGDVPGGLLDRCALLLGAEGPGLSSGALGAADLAARIPIARGVDSLNVAAAAAVAFYAVTHPPPQSCPPAP